MTTRTSESRTSKARTTTEWRVRRFTCSRDYLRGTEWVTFRESDTFATKGEASRAIAAMDRSIGYSSHANAVPFRTEAI